MNRLPLRHHVGPRKSEAVVAGGLVFLAGQVCPEAEDKDVEVQTTRILSNIDEYLAIAGSDRNHLVSATVWLRDIGEIDGMNRAWQAWLPEGCAPARATVQALLGGPHYRVEIALVAQLRG